MRRFATSIVIVSPSWTAAIGPPTSASGATWPTMKPRVAPEKRPSVSSATSSPSPSPTSAAGDARASRACRGRRPGPRCGSRRRRRPRSARAVTAAIASSSHSNTRAGPAWCDRSWPESLIDGALGREVAAQDRQAAGRLDRVVDGPHDLLAGRLDRLARVLADRAAGDGRRVLVQHAGLEQALGDDARCRPPRRGPWRRSGRRA